MKMLFFYVLLTCATLLVLINPVPAAVWTSDNEEGLDTELELDELDFEDICKLQVIPYAWEKVTSTATDKDLGIGPLETLANNQRERATAYDAEHAPDEYPSRAAILARKLELAMRPGDVKLPAEKYAQLLVFADDVARGVRERRAACSAAGTCAAVTSRDPDQLLAAWQQSSSSSAAAAANASSTSTPETRRRYADTLAFVGDAAKANGSPDAESYWLMLSELRDDGYRKAQTLWTEVRPLYQKLHRWVAKHLLKQFGPNAFEETDRNNPATRLPAQLLGSRLGDDWSNIADLVLSNECKEVYNHIEASLNEKQIVGKSLYQLAEKMTNFLGVGKLDRNFWKESVFDSACPARFVDPCRADPRVAACNTTSWSGYLDGHEITMRSIHSQLATSSPQGHSYLLKNADRFSAVDHGVAGMATLVAGNRHYLAQSELLRLPANGCVKDALYVLLALRVLPQLPYYLVADLARLEAVRTNRTADIGKIWSQMRRDNNMQGLSTPEGGEWWGFLEDPRVAANRPLVSHFYGVFVQFQLFEELLMRDASSSGDAEEFIRSRAEFRMLLELGMSKKWPDLLEESFGFATVTSSPLLRFFGRLEALITPVPKAPPKVPKDSRTSADSAAPQEEEADREDAPLVPGLEDAANATLDDAGGVPASNGTTATSIESDATGVGHYVLIAGAVVIAIAVFGVVASYARKYMKKEHHYQRPANQPA